MTIREYILEGALKSAETRLDDLIKLNAPRVIIDGQQEYVNKLKAGELNIGGDTSVLDEEFVSREMKKGRGGKAYIVINENVNFFPNARYGMYIRRAE